MTAWNLDEVERRTLLRRIAELEFDVRAASAWRTNDVRRISELTDEVRRANAKIESCRLLDKRTANTIHVTMLRAAECMRGRNAEMRTRLQLAADEILKGLK